MPELTHHHMEPIVTSSHLIKSWDLLSIFRWVASRDS
jgi:hypothetical protein